jgi:hypothetical protein
LNEFTETVPIPFALELSDGMFVPTRQATIAELREAAVVAEQVRDPEYRLRVKGLAAGLQEVEDDSLTVAEAVTGKRGGG